MPTVFVCVGQTSLLIGKQLEKLFEEYCIRSSSYHLLYIDDESPISPTVVEDALHEGSSSSRRTCSTTMHIPRQKWGGVGFSASEKTGLSIIQMLVDLVVGSLDGRVDVLLLFTPTDASSSATTSRVAQMLPDFIPHALVSACTVFRPLDTSGPGSLHAVLGLQYVLTYCDNILLRDMSDYLRLFAQFCNTPPSIDDLCKSVAVDLMLLPLVHSSIAWTCNRANKIMDMRSSLWHKIFVKGSNSVRRDRPHDPARAVTTTLHVLSLTAADNCGHRHARSAGVRIANLCQFSIDTRHNIRVSSRLGTGSSLQGQDVSNFTMVVPSDSFLLCVEKQLSSATLKFSWPGITRSQCCVVQNNDVEHATKSTSGLETMLLFDSPFAICKLRAILTQAEQLLCSSKGAFLQRFWGPERAHSPEALRRVQLELTAAIASLEEFLL